MADEKVDVQGVQKASDTDVSKEVESKIEVKDDSALKDLPADELVKIIHDTRSEAKTRRLKQRELEGLIEETKKNTELQKQTELEKNEEWETAYNKLKDDTKDYTDLKTFKDAYLKECEVEIEKLKPTLTKPELEIFDMSAKGMIFTEQVLFIKKLIENRPVTPSVTDNTQSTGRSNGGQPVKTEKVTIPFGNTSSVLGKIMENLKLKREEK